MAPTSEYEVERLRGHTYVDRAVRYLVVWAGCPNQDSWVSLSSLANAPDALADYHAEIKHTPPQRSDDGRCAGCGKFTAVTNH